MNTLARLAPLAAVPLVLVVGLLTARINHVRIGQLLTAPLVQVRPQTMPGACADQWMAYLRDR